MADPDTYSVEVSVQDTYSHEEAAPEGYSHEVSDPNVYGYEVVVRTPTAMIKLEWMPKASR